MASLWQGDSKAAPASNPHLPVHLLLCNLLSSSVSWSSNRPLINDIQQDDGWPFWTEQHKMLQVAGGLSAAVFDEASSGLGKLSWPQELKTALGQQSARNWGCQTNSLQGTESCQKPHELGSGSFPGQALKSDPTPGQHLEGSPVRDSETDNPVTPCSDSWPWSPNCEIINAC